MPVGTSLAGRRDEVVRMHVAFLINQTWPGDLALKASMQTFNFAWTSTGNEKLDHLAQDSLTTAAGAGAVVRYDSPPMEYEQDRKRQRGERGGRDRGGERGAGSAGSAGDGGAAWPQKDKAGRWKINTTPGKNRWVCGGFQTEDGCRKPGCIKEHVCAVIVAPGRICGRSDHGACNHGRNRR